MSVTIKSDLSQQVNWVVREKTDCSLSLAITLSSVAYDIATYTFIAEFYKVGVATPFLSVNPTNGGATGILTINLTDTQLTIIPDQYFWKLKTTAPTDNLWFQGVFTVNGYIWDGASNSTTTVALTIGVTTLNVSLSIISGGQASSVTITNWAGTVTLPTAIGFGEFYKFTNAGGCDVPYLGGSVHYEFDSIILSKGAGNTPDKFYQL